MFKETKDRLLGVEEWGGREKSVWARLLPRAFLDGLDLTWVGHPVKGNSKYEVMGRWDSLTCCGNYTWRSMTDQSGGEIRLERWMD